MKNAIKCMLQVSHSHLEMYDNMNEGGRVSSQNQVLSAFPHFAPSFQVQGLRQVPALPKAAIWGKLDPVAVIRVGFHAAFRGAQA